MRNEFENSEIRGNKIVSLKSDEDIYRDPAIIEEEKTGGWREVRRKQKHF